MKNEYLEVSLFYTPTAGQSGYKGGATAISSENKLGKFDILPEHTNFISLIFNKLVIQTIGGRNLSFAFRRGVLEVSENQVRVFLGI